MFHLWNILQRQEQCPRSRSLNSTTPGLLQMTRRSSYQLQLFGRPRSGPEQVIMNPSENYPRGTSRGRRLKTLYNLNHGTGENVEA